MAVEDAEKDLETRDSGSDVAFWLAVSRVPYIGPARTERLVQRFGTLQAAWSASRDDLRAALEAKPLA
ncbi:MAG: hypothetical protein ACRDJC_00555, partial [Thermomicrobiales bacterium]